MDLALNLSILIGLLDVYVAVLEKGAAIYPIEIQSSHVSYSILSEEMHGQLSYVL